jgi:hypothetical protein
MIGIVLSNELGLARGMEHLGAFEKLISFEYYSTFFDGVKTDTIAQLALWFTPMFMWYPIKESGNFLN